MQTGAWVQDRSGLLAVPTDGWSPHPGPSRFRHLGVVKIQMPPGQSMGGMMTKTPDMAHIPNAWLPYFRCPTRIPPPSASRPRRGTFALHHLKA
jgi:hypothetical protein